jgi:asparagine synthase (glutamine-hydrolysing)
MCGIAGILTTNPHEVHLERSINSMQSALHHRGPDDAGIYMAPDHQCTLAHTRLSILDLSENGHQPMPSADQRYWITFNGEIYNFQALRSQLESEGEHFISRTDTEVILKLYQRLGKDCVKQLRGMFAFAIWDDWEKSCFLARDPLGIKPLYYWQSSTTLIFASELRALLASSLPKKQLCPQGLYGYLTTGSVPEPYSLIEGVQTIEAGHWLFWQSGNLQYSKYWQLEFTPQAMTAPEAVQITRKALIESIQHHFVSDVPVGIFLSGGIDSTSVLALSRQVQTGSLNTYSIAFEEEKWNEGDIAQKIARHFGANHTEYKVSATLGRSLLPKFLSAIDQPSIDGFNTFCVSQVAHHSGSKVVLSGLGGDELFGGYQSFQKVPQLIRFGQCLKSFQPLTAIIGHGLERWSPSVQVRRLGDFLQQTPAPVTAYRSFRGIFSHWEACQIANLFLPDQEFCKRPHHILQQQPDVIDEVSCLEITQYMRNQLLHDSDVMSMFWGLELRVPFVDQVLLEAIASIPSQMRLASKKQLLTQSIPELPDWVIHCPKRGFFFPYEQWFTHEWHDYFQNIPCPQNIPLKQWYRRWSLAIFQHWWEQISP